MFKQILHYFNLKNHARSLSARLDNFVQHGTLRREFKKVPDYTIVFSAYVFDVEPVVYQIIFRKRVELALLAEFLDNLSQELTTLEQTELVKSYHFLEELIPLLEEVGTARKISTVCRTMLQVISPRVA